MSKRVIVGDAEFLTPQDFERFNEFPQGALDAVVGDAIAWPAGWAGVTVARVSAQSVTVSPGRYFEGDIVYEAEEAQTINLTTYLPIAPSDEKFVALILRGRTNNIDEERAFETSTDVETSEPVASQVPVIAHRTFEVVIQQGTAAPPPALLPTIAATDACLAYVRLTTQGVQEIQPGEGWRVKSLYEVEGRVTSLEILMDQAFAEVAALQTDLANLQARANDIPNPELIRQMQRDISQTRRLLNLPDEARAYFYDSGLVKDKWDLNHPQWLARVAEGIRFANAAEREVQMALVNPAQDSIRIVDQVLLPKWTEIMRLDVSGSGSTKDISQQVHTTVEAKKRTVSRSAVRYGPTVAMCDNVDDWAQIGKVRAGQTFQVNGETFEKIGLIDESYAGTTIDTSIFNEIHDKNYGMDMLIIHNATAEERGNRLIYAARSVHVDTWTETYWDYVTNTFGVNGSVYGQTFLVSHPMVLTSISLNFSRVGNSGDVTLMLCETSATGQPLLDRMIASSVLPRSKLSTGWVRFPFTPSYLPAGRRYAWVAVTVGNHALRTVTGAKYSQGTLFWSTDGAWFDGNLQEDFQFRLNAAKFQSLRTVVEFEPLTLENGMTEIRLVYSNWCPEGCQMMWEVQPAGSTEWTPLQGETDDNPNPLLGLPALTRLRLTMIGTTDLAPAIIMDSYARALTARPRTDMRCVSKQLNFGVNTTSIQVEIAADQFDEALHDCEPKLIVGSTTYTPTVVSDAPDLAKSTRRIFKATFTVPSTNNARLLVQMNTSTAQRIPFVERAYLFAL